MRPWPSSTSFGVLYSPGMIMAGHSPEAIGAHSPRIQRCRTSEDGSSHITRSCAAGDSLLSACARTDTPPCADIAPPSWRRELQLLRCSESLTVVVGRQIARPRDKQLGRRQVRLPFIAALAACAAAAAAAVQPKNCQRGRVVMVLIGEKLPAIAGSAQVII